jgi:ATP-binding cassette subfamily C protein
MSGKALPVRVKTPMVLQMEATECGAASLGIVLAHYGRWEALSTLRVACGVSRDGSRASSILQAARRYGMDAKGFRKTVEGLEQLEGPAILFWQFCHFLVFEGFDGDDVLLNDPAFGHRRVSRGELERDFTGVVLVLRPAEGFERGGRPPSWWPSLRRRLAGQEGALGFVAAAGLLLVAPGLAIPVFSQVFIDRILIARSTTWLAPLLGIMLLTILAQVALQHLQRQALARLKLRLSVKLASSFVGHLLRLPMRFHGSRYAGELASRSMLNDRVSQAAAGQLTLGVVDTVMLVFYVGVMLWYDVLLTSIAVTLAVLSGVILRHAATARTEAEARTMQVIGRATGVAISGLRSIETVKASGLEDDLFAQWAGHYASSVNAKQQQSLAGQQVAVIGPTMIALVSALVIVLGGFRVMNGAISIGELVGFQSLMGAFLAPLGRMLNLVSEMQTLQGDLSRLDDVMEEKPDKELLGASVVGVTSLSGQVTAEGLTFGFSPVAPPMLENFSLSIEPGAWVSFVGGSGSGKSTLLRLFAGLHHPWSGQVLLDGHPRSALPHGLRQDQIGFVDQDVLIFEGTVRDNLTLWDPDVPDEALVRACRDASILDVVRALPGGFDGKLDEGARNLSGGEKQRLEIARALVRDPAVLLLDEATSALDPITERAVLQALRARGCTVIMVAHRLSAFRDCDVLIVLQQGKEIERGTHADLWASGGAYRQLIGEAE